MDLLLMKKRTLFIKIPAVSAHESELVSWASQLSLQTLGMMVLSPKAKDQVKIVEKSSMQNLQMSINMLNSSKDIVWYDFHFLLDELGID